MRTSRPGVVLGALLAAGLAVGCTDHAKSAVPVAAPTLAVTCTKTGTQLDATTIDASSDGVHLHLTDVSGFTDTYLNYSFSPNWQSGGGGDRATAAGSDLVVTAPPGTLTFQCTHDSSNVNHTKATVQVTDTGAYYVEPKPNEICKIGGIADYVKAAAPGSTERAAVDNWVTATKQPKGTVARKVRAGYLHQSPSLWILDVTGVPSIQVLVTRKVSPAATTYHADGSMFCVGQGPGHQGA